MKTFKKLFYTGLFLILSPFLVFFFVFYFSSSNEDKIKEPKTQKKIVYDTIKVKVFDTVIIERIKYVKKPEVINKDTTKN